MALKADRDVQGTYIDFFLNETASRGVVVCASTVGSGIAMDQSQQLATVSASPSGKQPLGILLNDMVDIDLTRQHTNWHKDEVQKGGKVTIMNRGWVVTDRVYPGQTPAVGNEAYIAHSGFIAPSDLIGDGDSLIIGAFLSGKDENGYAKVAVNLPNANS